MSKKKDATHEMILERIDGLKEHVSFRLDDLKEDIKEMKPAVKANTEFRLKAKGIIGVVGVIATAVGGLLMWLADKGIKLFYKIKGGG